jgi:hypothetical protein
VIAEYDSVVLTRDLPAVGLRRGDIGTVVHVHQGGNGFEVEFTTLNGETLAVETVLSKDVRAAGSREIAHVREMV